VFISLQLKPDITRVGLNIVRRFKAYFKDTEYKRKGNCAEAVRMCDVKSHKTCVSKAAEILVDKNMRALKFLIDEK
jgi:hypothetical protein